jgi:hypothetical protein
MTAYHRPAITGPVFHDRVGAVIEYGKRWHGSSPPEDTYSVESNLERFKPLHLVAEALITHLNANYDIRLRDDPSVVADLLHPPSVEVLRAVRLTPVDPDAAPLTFVVTAYPGVTVHAGLLCEFFYPVCGCDACDERWETVAEDMEWQVLAVVAGEFDESVHRSIGLGVSHSLDGLGRHLGGRSRAADYDRTRLGAARKRLRTLHDGWRPWPPIRRPNQPEWQEGTGGDV